ncbi:MAG TPA: hypothetical protein PLI52_01265 [Prochlorococcaceae cyanobacterium AMR_MDS_5431]|nr:hypothetical protein [Prochlorococcaceae cyanobacterium AMR_MDS_5431]
MQALPLSTEFCDEAAGFLADGHRCNSGSAVFSGVPPGNQCRGLTQHR